MTVINSTLDYQHFSNLNLLKINVMMQALNQYQVN